MPKSDRPKYIRHACRICRQDRNFKFIHGRNKYVQRVMVCTECGTQEARPGERKISWAEQMSEDYTGPGA